MHRVDIHEATGAPMVLTVDHDGVLVADVVAEWAERHGGPFRREVELDAVDSCRIVSGRVEGAGLLSVAVPS